MSQHEFIYYVKVNYTDLVKKRLRGFFLQNAAIYKQNEFFIWSYAMCYASLLHTNSHLFLQYENKTTYKRYKYDNND